VLGWATSAAESAEPVNWLEDGLGETWAAVLVIGVFALGAVGSYFLVRALLPSLARAARGSQFRWDDILLNKRRLAAQSPRSPPRQRPARPNERQESDSSHNLTARGQREWVDVSDWGSEVLHMATEANEATVNQL